MRHTTLASILTFSAACTAQADLLPAIEWEFASEEWNIVGGSAIGWTFTVTDELHVHQLGMYMSNSILIDPHQVGLFDASGALLALTELEPGHSNDHTAGRFTYNDVDLVTLQPGTLYLLLVDNLSNDSSALLNANSSFGEHIQWNSVAFTEDESIFSPLLTLDGPNDWLNEQGQAMGASFQYTLAPAPGAFALLALAGCTRRRRRRTHTHAFWLKSAHAQL